VPNPNRSLWKLYVVDPRGPGRLLFESEPIIAATENEVQLKSGIGKVISDAGLDVLEPVRDWGYAPQVDIYCEKIAEFIRPRKDTQKVVLAKDGDQE
jgi:hypothetical protein